MTVEDVIRRRTTLSVRGLITKEIRAQIFSILAS